MMDRTQKHTITLIRVCVCVCRVWKIEQMVWCFTTYIVSVMKKETRMV